MNERVDTLSGALGIGGEWGPGIGLKGLGEGPYSYTRWKGGRGEVVPAVCGIPVSEVVPEEKWHRCDDLSKMGK